MILMWILIVEDEQKVAAFLRQGLSEEGFRVRWVGNGKKALELLRSTDFEVVILDIMLPYIDGLEVLRIIRREGNDIPVLLLTARDAVQDRVQGLNCGADDYLVKPFAFEELLARIQALIRRKRGYFSEILQLADLKLDTYKKVVTRYDQIIHLTSLEYRILELLLRNKGRVVSKYEIEENIWGLNEDHNSNIVEVYINFLRKKIDKPFSSPLIHTVRGYGYKMENLRK